MKKDTALYLREAVEKDVDILFSWANDEDARKNSFCTEPIKYEDHVIWFQNMMQNESTSQYILIDQATPVGQIRLECDGAVGEISYSIAPDKRGVGYGKAICQLLIRKVCIEKPEIKKLTAKIKIPNVASVYCFEKNGFAESYSQYEVDIANAVLDDSLLRISPISRGDFC
ncbi:GNAT family N-acetyltransferase [Schaedlerella arabinosiphila]|uniref:GNAT family N-acetyltransferase n=1 Tax=Schaedlerella arabinosiphila TaxID=2044587 RepID=A0A9X5C6U8_9FIRM|nr:GNAT family N-acetyltransferase [Schaedlerella arabinosiphila]KAI4441768.1 hypothetical protein C824_004277 [Schaedlerella arabinosiphila]NDO68720.1 GNAT family N-acetyltransferase [Schaedlerella arabinosiphila]